MNLNPYEYSLQSHVEGERRMRPSEYALQSHAGEGGA